MIKTNAAARATMAAKFRFVFSQLRAARRRLFLLFSVRQQPRYLLGAWQSLATAVVGYWIGSSAGSATKDAALKQIAAAK